MRMGISDMQPNSLAHLSLEPGDVILPMVPVDGIKGVVLKLCKARDVLVATTPGGQNRSWSVGASDQSLCERAGMVNRTVFILNECLQYKTVKQVSCWNIG